jgi:two-component system chemotaxis family response regulator WspR
LEEFFDQEWRRGYRQQLPLSVVLCDVDYFKLYNDFYGHLAGDDALKKIAAVLQRRARRPWDLAARYGGEEFALVLGHTPADAAGLLAEQFLQDVVALGMPHEKTLLPHKQLTCSCGVYGAIPADAEVQQEQFFEPADAALYRAKQQGRNQVVVFNESAL